MSNKDFKRKYLKNGNLENISGGTTKDQTLNQTFKRKEDIDYAQKILSGEVTDENIPKDQAEKFLKQQGVID